MEFGIEKCTLLIIKSRKSEKMEQLKLSNEENIRTLAEKENNKCLAILEADTIKQTEMEETKRKGLVRRTSKLLENKLRSRNLIKGINSH